MWAVPRRWLYQNEEVLRYPSYLMHRGTAHECNVCGSQISSFIVQRDHLICPRCGSIQRNRRLWQLLSEEFLRNGMSILDFSPSRCIYRKLKSGEYDYTSTDLSGDFLADQSYDIQAIDADDASYDLIICYHILEHIPDDLAAMEEMLRVLKPGAYCLVQTPFKEGEIYENQDVVSPEERLHHFGQEDHVRIYSVEGLRDRLTRTGFEVEVRSYESAESNYHGFSTQETVLVCRRA